MFQQKVNEKCIENSNKTIFIEKYILTFYAPTFNAGTFNADNFLCWDF